MDLNQFSFGWPCPPPVNNVLATQHNTLPSQASSGLSNHIKYNFTFVHMHICAWWSPWQTRLFEFWNTINCLLVCSLPNLVCWVLVQSVYFVTQQPCSSGMVWKPLLVHTRQVEPHKNGSLHLPSHQTPPHQCSGQSCTVHISLTDNKCGTEGPETHYMRMYLRMYVHTYKQHPEHNVRGNGFLT